jgi:hypothetical protein
MRYFHSIQILALLVIGIATSHAQAAQTYTYEFIEGRGNYYRYGGSDGGGLLSGTFSLDVDGSQVSVKNFDIRIVPFPDFPPSAPSPPDLFLSDILGVDFLDSKGIVQIPGAILRGPPLPPRAFVGPSVTGTPLSISTGDAYFSVDPLDTPEAFFELHAPGKAAGEQIIISPPVTGNCKEFVCTGVAFLHTNIRLVPEPSTFILALATIAFGLYWLPKLSPPKSRSSNR